MSAILMFDRRGRVMHSRYTMKRDKTRGEIFLYGPIGASFWDEGAVSAGQFQKDLRALGKVEQIDLRINSPGGSVFDGQAMGALLKQHAATKTVYVDGVAASAAATLAMAGDEIIIAEGAFMMIHNASGMAFGDAKEMERMAGLLRTVNDEVAKQYADRAKMKVADVLDMMDAETWMTADDAVAKGFADKVAKGQKVTNMISDSTGFKNIPGALKERPNRVRAAAMLASIRR